MKPDFCSECVCKVTTHQSIRVWTGNSWWRLVMCHVITLWYFWIVQLTARPPSRYTPSKVVNRGQTIMVVIHSKSYKSNHEPPLRKNLQSGWATRISLIKRWSQSPHEGVARSANTQFSCTGQFNVSSTLIIQGSTYHPIFVIKSRPRGLRDVPLGKQTGRATSTVHVQDSRT